ncbi:transposase for insertion sequence element IS232 (plasmid) [Bacillus thuringiensis Bt18247]|uniref:Transposase for insertion sequence element IS232 n=1 Tax=Bacillus thuringiensis Bt18247 TaxID=1423143 RepID=A0A9W3SZD4_BACTU|nr:transposase for insertion sequence element IS232 [Bacillus thuringiensis Bt18247]
MSMKSDNNHLLFFLYYHLVLVVKYRRDVFNDDISDYAKDMFVKLSENYNITLVAWNYDVDHVYILFKARPNTEMTKFINAYKSASSRLIKRDFPQNFGFKVQPFIAGRPNTKETVETSMKLLDEIHAYQGTFTFKELHQFVQKLCIKINQIFHRGT